MPQEHVWSAPGRRQRKPPTPPPKPKVGLQSQRYSQLVYDNAATAAPASAATAAPASAATAARASAATAAPASAATAAPASAALAARASAATAAHASAATESMRRLTELHECNQGRLGPLGVEQHHKLQQRLNEFRRQDKKNMSNDYLLDADDDDLYATRINYLQGERGHQRAPMLLNQANTGRIKGQKTIFTYHQGMQKPTKDLQALVMLMVREEINKEINRLSLIVSEQNPLEMRNMRPNSFISNTPDLIDFWKVAMLDECKRVIEDSLEHEDLSWASPGLVNGLQIPMPVDENVLVLMLPDKPEISKSQVAHEYIQAQRGHQADSGQEDSNLMFQNELLRSENAAVVSPEVFDRIVNCHRLVVQKLMEIDYIENKPETRFAVDSFIDELKSGSDDRVVQGLIRSDFDASGVFGRMLVRSLVGQVMDELHAYHNERGFEPLYLSVSMQQ